MDEAAGSGLTHDWSRVRSDVKCRTISLASARRMILTSFLAFGCALAPFTAAGAIPSMTVLSTVILSFDLGLGARRRYVIWRNCRKLNKNKSSGKQLLQVPPRVFSFGLNG